MRFTSNNQTIFNVKQETALVCVFVCLFIGAQSILLIVDTSEGVSNLSTVND